MTQENLGREESPGPGARDREPGTGSLESNGAGVKWGWSQMRLESNEAGVKWGWSPMGLESNGAGVK